MTIQSATAPSPRTRIRRNAEQADYERHTLHSIIDAAFLCQIAFHDEKGTHCIPMACWREGEHLYIHGSNGGRLIKALSGERQVCVAITHLDGLVLARSAFNHSMNYRSAVIYGNFERVSDETAKRASLDVFMDKLAPGRSREARPGNDKEFAATTVMCIALDEAVSKVRTGAPVDDAEDMGIPVWAGVLPFVQLQTAPQPDMGMNSAQIDIPRYVRDWDQSGFQPDSD